MHTDIHLLQRNSSRNEKDYQVYELKLYINIT